MNKADIAEMIADATRVTENPHYYARGVVDLARAVLALAALEEALELVQACGCAAAEAHQLVDYVYGRPQGDVNQEVGGVMVTLAALCLANGVDMHAGGEAELARINVPETVRKIRTKQATKPKGSALPVASEVPEKDAT